MAPDELGDLMLRFQSVLAHNRFAGAHGRGQSQALEEEIERLWAV